MTAPYESPVSIRMKYGRLFSHNVVVTFVFKLTVGLAYGVWSSGQASLWISKLYEDSHSLPVEDKKTAALRVGFVSALSGTFGVIAALPSGWVADRTRRDHVLKACGLLSLVAIAMYSSALIMAPAAWHVVGREVLNKYFMWCIGAVLWGVTTGCSSVSDALLADSVPTGGRSTVYALLYSSTLLMTTCGPVLGALMFMRRGNDWSIRTLESVMLVGMGLQIIPGVTAFFFNDDKALGAESDALPQNGSHQRLLNGIDEEDSDYEEDGTPAVHPLHCTFFSPASIPLIIMSSDILYGLASGMTIKFFPLFFKDIVGLSPVALHFVLAAQPISIAVGSLVVRGVAHMAGRVQTIVFFKMIGVTLMGLMAVMGFKGDGELWKKVGLMVPIFLIRTSVNNACSPLSNSILMDFLPKDRRALWNSLHSVISWGWAGSALLGGYLIERHGYQITFMATAAVQLFSWLVLLLLLPLVPRRECGFASPSSMDPLPQPHSEEEEALLPDEELQRQPTPRMHRVDSSLSMSFRELAEAEKGTAVTGFDDG